MFVFGDFNVHHKHWRSSSGAADRPGELCCSEMILLIMFNFPTGIPDCDSHSPPLLDLYIPSDASICSAMTFLAWRNSGHVAVLISIDFLPNSKGNVPFHSTAYD